MTALAPRFPTVAGAVWGPARGTSRHVTGRNAMVGAAGAGPRQTGPTPVSPPTLGTDADDVVDAAATSSRLEVDGDPGEAPKGVGSRPHIESHAEFATDRRPPPRPVVLAHGATHRGRHLRALRWAGASGVRPSTWLW